MNRITVAHAHTWHLKPLIKESLFMLNICGLNPNKQNVLNRIIFATVLLMFVHLNIESLFQCIFNWKEWESVEEIFVFSILIRLIFKCIIIIIHKEKLTDILRDMEMFWSWEELDEVFQSQIRDISQCAIKSAKLLFLLILSAVVTYPLKTLFLNTRTIFFDFYVPVDKRSGYYYLITYTVQIFEAVLLCFTIIAFDCLFISFILHIICELKILKQRFSKIHINLDTKIEDKHCLNKFNKLISHHNVVLRCIQNLNEVYSGVFLNQFIACGICSCVTIFSMVDTGFPPDFKHLFRYVLFAFAILPQLLIYCLMGTLLITESEGVSDSVYESMWWGKPQPKLRKACVLIIQRANRRQMLIAGGTFPLNFESITKMGKYGLALFSLSQALCSRKKQE